MTDLAPRELEVLKLAGAGLLHKEIADRLQTSVHTVDKQMESIYTKLGVHDRVHLAHYALHHGLIANRFGVLTTGV